MEGRYFITYRAKRSGMHGKHAMPSCLPTTEVLQYHRPHCQLSILEVVREPAAIESTAHAVGLPALFRL